jgi:hypothetical protein
MDNEAMRRYLLWVMACLAVGCGGLGLSLQVVTVGTNEWTLIDVHAPEPWTCAAERGGCTVFSSNKATYFAPPTPGSDEVRIYHRNVRVERIGIWVSP